jgi:hypothetical protein
MRWPAAPLATASASAKAIAKRIHRADARIRRIGGSYNDFVHRVSPHGHTLRILAIAVERGR